jgi:hypothetical protein
MALGPSALPSAIGYLLNVPVRASAADAFTGVLPLRVLLPGSSARPYCLAGLREKLYPREYLMSTPVAIDFPVFEAEVICLDCAGGTLPQRGQCPRSASASGDAPDVPGQAGCSACKSRAVGG